MARDGTKSGGRPKGSPNKRSFDAQALAQKLNVDPLEILLRFAMGDWEGLGYTSSEMLVVTKTGESVYVDRISPELRAKAAGDASNYIYPRRKAIEHSSPDGTNPFQSLTQVLADAVRKINAGSGNSGGNPSGN